MTRISTDSTEENTYLEKGLTAKEVSGSQGRMIRSEIVDPNHHVHGYIEQKVDETDELGNMPSIDLGEYYIARTIDAMEKWYSKPREGYHVTDVCLCPRQRVYREIDRRPLSHKDLNVYSSGKAIHEAIQWLFLSDKRTFEREKYVEHCDIQGSVDIYDRKRNIPLEFKTSRSADIKEPKNFQVEQLKYYMSMLDAQEGYMLYQCLLHFGDKPFKAFKITMNAQERSDQRNKLVREVQFLKRAMEAADTSLARGVSEDPALNWLCKNCPYLTECKRIQDAAVAAS